MEAVFVSTVQKSWNSFSSTLFPVPLFQKCSSFPFAELLPFNRQLVLGGREVSPPALKYWHSGAVVQEMSNFSVCMAAGIIIYLIV